MNVAVGWPVLAMPKKSVIGAVLAAIVLATTLVTAPVPLVNEVSEASAHTQRRCFTETVTVPMYSSNPAYAGGPTGYEEQSRTTCINEACRLRRRPCQRGARRQRALTGSAQIRSSISNPSFPV